MQPYTLRRLKLEGIEKQNIEDLMNMDAAKNVDELMTIGEAAAADAVMPAHFPKYFNLSKKLAIDSSL